MKKTRAYVSLAAAAALFSLPASAQSDRAVGCSYYQPGMLAFITGVRPAPCAYQGDYMVNQGPMYDGPARPAPQPTYAPTPMAQHYPYVHGQYRMSGAPAAETTVVRRTTRSKRITEKRAVKGKRMTVGVKNELPPAKGKPKIVKAQAEVRIYGPDRMEIRLFRR
jgi:hypothetical protein